jgi:multicomponent Na+:H+ antiporter subunit F
VPVELTAFLRSFLVAALILLAILGLLCLLRAALGPRFTDRVLATNAVSALVVAALCIAAYLLGESYLLDVAILYALLNLLAMVIMTRIVFVHERELRRKKAKRASKDASL